MWNKRARARFPEPAAGCFPREFPKPVCRRPDCFAIGDSPRVEANCGAVIFQRGFPLGKQTDFAEYFVCLLVDAGFEGDPPLCLRTCEGQAVVSVVSHEREYWRISGKAGIERLAPVGGDCPASLGGVPTVLDVALGNAP